MRTILTIAAVIAVPVAARADEPEYLRKFQHDLGYCKPSCYDNESFAKWDASDIKRVCGFKEWGFTMTQQRNGRWTPLVSDGIPAANPDVSACKLPGDSGGSWASAVKQARAAFAPLKDDLKNLHFVVHGAWQHGHDNMNNPTKSVRMRIYASNWGSKPNECGTHGNTVCEASGSKTARAANIIRYRLDEAKKYETSNAEACQVSSFAAVAYARGLKKFHDRRVKKKSWTTGLVYKLRYDGELDDKKVFEKIDDYEAQGVALHAKCGGASPLVTEAATNSPEYEIVPSPELDD